MFLPLVPQGVAYGAPGADCVTDVHQQPSELANQNPRSTNGSNYFIFHCEPAHPLLPTSDTGLSASHRVPRQVHFVITLGFTHTIRRTRG